MPKKVSAEKPPRVFRSKDEIQRILSEVSAAQAAGSTVTAALKDLNVSDNTYFKWRQKYGATPVPAPAAKEKTQVKQPARSERIRFSQEQKDDFQKEDQDLKSQGKTDDQIAKSLGISKSTLYRLRKLAPKAAVRETTRRKQPSKFGSRYTDEQKDAFRKEDQNLKAQGKTDGRIAKVLGISTTTLYALRKSGKKVAAKRTTKAAQPIIELSPDNPLYQVAVAHERLMRLNEEIAKLESEKAEIGRKMAAMAAEAADVWVFQFSGK